MHDCNLSHDSDDDGLGCPRGIINGTPVSLLLWGAILGAVVWVFG